MLQTKTMESENIVKELSQKNNEPGWLLDKRLAAYELFRKTPMPNFIYGLNINMNIDLNLGNIDVSESGKANIEIKNNNKDVIIWGFDDRIKNREAVFEKNLMQCIKPTDKFTSFHQAFLNNLTFIYIPKNVEVKEPIEISSTMDSNVLFDHMIVLAEDNTKATLVENSKSGNNDNYNTQEFNNKKNNNKNFNNYNINNKNNTKNEIEDSGKNSDIYRSKIVEIYIGKNCNINYGNVQLLSQNTFNFTIKKAIVGADSTLNWIDCCFGSRVTLSEVSTILNADGAMTNNHGIFFGSRNQQFDLVANSIHNAPHTVSDIFTKGALTGSSKCVYRGLVKINQNAFGSNGYQKEDTLLLSQDAAADSIPNLEIDNNDVRCTHGASIGRIDREKMFYMQSRGLNEKQATKEYVKGFFEPLIQKIQIQHLRDNMHEMIESRMQ